MSGFLLNTRPVSLNKPDRKNIHTHTHTHTDGGLKKNFLFFFLKATFASVLLVGFISVD